MKALLCFHKEFGFSCAFRILRKGTGFDFQTLYNLGKGKGHKRKGRKVVKIVL